MKILSIVGARPQFIKAKPLIDAFLKIKARHILVHTGQHYDYEMSQLFFDELAIQKPDYNLGIGSSTQGTQTGRMLEKIEGVLLKVKPDIVVVYGDTNSTLAGALASVKLGIPLAHVEAGLRSFRLDMPEEINRILTDRVSSLLFCPTKTAVKNLKEEGVKRGIYLVGDIMRDILEKSSGLIKRRKILQRLKILAKGYTLLTVHRQENTDNRGNLKILLSALASSDERIIFPIHPRTEKALHSFGKPFLKNLNNFIVIKPVSYLDMLCLLKNANKVFTDSGGIQKEAYWLRIPCITLRNETEWVETLEEGWNVLAGVNRRKILSLLKHFKTPKGHRDIFKDTNTADKIAEIISKKTHSLKNGCKHIAR